MRASRLLRTLTTAPLLAGLLATGTAAALAAAPAAPELTAVSDVSSDAVINPVAAVDTTGWRAASAAGPVSLTRATGLAAPGSVTTGVRLTRTGGTGSWGYALASLRNPATFFQPGRTYQMQLQVRDNTATGASIGILLANQYWANQPTRSTAYGRFPDSAWHLLTRTFVAEATGAVDTALYLALPGSGGFDFTVTAASVAPVTDDGPPTVTTPPARTLSFTGPAGAAPDTSVWNHDTGGHGWGNKELQTYTNRRTNSALDGAGNLVLTARRETWTGTDAITRQYTSARLNTKNKVNVAPGSYLEANLLAPTGTGMWPAFWLLGANIDTVRWPACGEIDILEGVGSSPTKAHHATHAAAATNPNLDLPYGWSEAAAVTDLGSPLSVTRHRYGVYFDNDIIRFYIDRKPTLTLYAKDALASGRTWPFNQNQYILLNVAIGSSDPAAVAASTAFPGAMNIAPIQIWTGGIPF